MTSPTDDHAGGRWVQLVIVSLGILLAMAPWFGASGVALVLVDDWGLGGLELPLLTVVVQLGFAVGAILLGISGAVDVMRASHLFFLGAVVAALANLGFALADDLATALPFRALTGFALAAVYPVSMKLVVGWFRLDRGLAIGVLVGAITVGSALPYLFRAAGSVALLDWRAIVAFASLSALVGGIVVVLGSRDGPFDEPSPRLSFDLARRAFREPGVRLASLGYLGHNWELHAMWTWIPIFFLGSFAAAGADDPTMASLAAFVVVAIGGIGSVVAGVIADRIGRTSLTIGAMAVSGTAAVLTALAFGADPLLTLILAMIWGATTVADSAQFSAAVTELTPSGTAGSALTLQMAAGFALNGVAILVVGSLVTSGTVDWRIPFAILAIGPAIGIISMWRLRRRPEAVRMAQGRR